MNSAIADKSCCRLASSHPTIALRAFPAQQAAIAFSANGLGSAENTKARAVPAQCDHPALHQRRAIATGLRHRGTVVGRILVGVIAVLFTGLSTRGAGSITPPAPGVSFDQRLGAVLPLDVSLRDERGQPIRFGDYFGRQPAVLVFGYSRCPELCSVISNATVQTLRDVRLTAGRDFTVLYVSIDPTDTPRDLAAMKHRDVGRYGRSNVETGWHYLVGNEQNVRRLASAAGFNYTFDERSRLYAHPSGFLILTPEGRIAQYFLGVDFDRKDVAQALERAAAGKTGATVFNLLLVCARGLGIAGRYGRIIWVSLEIAVVLTVVVVFGGIGWMFWQEGKRNTGPRDGGIRSANLRVARQPDNDTEASS